MVHRLACVPVIFGLLVTGCRTPTNERVLVRYEPAGRPEVRKAPYHGQYRLYASRMRRPTTASAMPLVEARLTKGEPVGFFRDGAGGLFAVVRGEHKPLSASAGTTAAGGAAYAWTMQPDPGQFDPGRTALLITTVVVIGVVTGAALAAASVPSISFGPIGGL